MSKPGFSTRPNVESWTRVHVPSRTGTSGLYGRPFTQGAQNASRTLSNTLAPPLPQQRTSSTARRKERGRERAKGIDYEDDHERYERCGLRHGVRASSCVCAVRVDAAVLWRRHSAQAHPARMGKFGRVPTSSKLGQPHGPHGHPRAQNVLGWRGYLCRRRGAIGTA